MGKLLPIKWCRYIPKEIIPHPKQAAFLFLPHEEALYGGAGFGGKSAALAMAALQHFDCKGYSGILFRRKLTDHKLNDSILSLIKKWVGPFLASGEIVYRPSEHTMYSKEGGSLTFGYMDKEGSRERYMSAQFHFCGYDELTHFAEDEYTFLFSRIRRTRETKHIPLRMRGATNPGSKGHAWVKKRFKIERDEDGEFRGHNLDRPFIQAKVSDNPHADAKDYNKKLDNLDPVWRDRMKNGDWSASEAAVFRDTWFTHRWKKKGEYYNLTDQNGVRVFHENEVFLFTSVDSAASERTGIEGKTFYQNQDPSWSVCALFGMTPDFDLLWLDNYRSQVHIPYFIAKICDMHREHKPAMSLIESNSIGQGVYQGVRAKGVNVIPVPAVPDKVTRATAAILRAEQGKVWLPAFSNWLPDLEDELFVWTGLKGETDDQIDVLSLAGEFVSHKAVGSEIDRSLGGGRFQSVPKARGGLWLPGMSPAGGRGLFAGRR